jgi:P-type Cu+ transporter
MTVDKRTALTAERNGRTYYFCSEGCRHAFEADLAEGRPLQHAHAHAEH